MVHLAARVHLMRDTSPDPLGEFRRVNVAFTLNLASQAARAGVRRFVFISSVKVNGESVTPDILAAPMIWLRSYAKTRRRRRRRIGRMDGNRIAAPQC